ncbi:hypothetical protein RE428_10640 [Marinobacter nanhaiticus D15-8W]|uniref:Uncharacterized protein n=1 Tax=Marinobacter nanhaiticus D15-8W TaxID=626887 RepID=N6WMM5_9GAMM|nr:hypothetical protein [Marinobacter nanhaiticus]ENO12706.2 hypothetical protein J057_14930 [Marinobacter nanhaiticus D15-8W]BES70046.1 hypothetical protein RE428_10640 [Marinobacter nanhaiticus D15-8W]
MSHRLSAVPHIVRFLTTALLMPGLMFSSGCALTMTNTLDTVGEREQSGEIIVRDLEENHAIPTKIHEFNVDNNFFYSLALQTSISKSEKGEGGTVRIPFNRLTSSWTEVNGTLDGEPAVFEARQRETDYGYKVEVRREYSEWYAYPFNALATAITPIDAAKNFTITYSAMILFAIVNPFIDASIPIVPLTPTGY